MQHSKMRTENKLTEPQRLFGVSVTCTVSHTHTGRIHVPTARGQNLSVADFTACVTVYAAAAEVLSCFLILRSTNLQLAVLVHRQISRL